MLAAINALVDDVELVSRVAVSQLAQRVNAERLTRLLQQFLRVFY